MNIVFMMLVASVFAFSLCVSSERAERQDFAGTNICHVTEPSLSLFPKFSEVVFPVKRVYLGHFGIWNNPPLPNDQIGHFGNIP